MNSTSSELIMRSPSAGFLCKTDALDRIVVVDDDPGFYATVREYLGTHGFAVDYACDNDGALRQAADRGCHLVLLATGLPGIDEFRLLRTLREMPHLDTIMLTGFGGDIDRILGLEMGADDYLSKPFHPRELLARIHALQRRKQKQWMNDCLKVDDIEMDLSARTVSWQDQPLDLTTSEFALLEILLRSAGHIVSREYLVQSVLARQFSPFDRSLDMLVSRLRKKLDAAGLADRVKTVRSLGYQFARTPFNRHLQTTNIAVG